jgi:hypothetical protein
MLVEWGYITVSQLLYWSKILNMADTISMTPSTNGILVPAANTLGKRQALVYHGPVKKHEIIKADETFENAAEEKALKIILPNDKSS